MAVAVIVALGAACATRPDQIPARYVSPLIYARATCAQLVDELATLSSLQEPLARRINRSATIDAVWVGAYVPLFVLLPFTFFLLHGDGADYEQYTSLLGQRNAVEEQMRRKRCRNP